MGMYERNLAKQRRKGIDMDGKTTVKYLQNYIKQKDHHPELLKDYFLKLSEEVGELSRAMRKGMKAPNSREIKGTIDEEVWDVIYYAIAIANLYDIDLEEIIKSKEEINRSRYPSSVTFEENR
nr:MazG nucleotide pyrophosphohydrolase domain-containing protein [uncultured Acetatifactor sp.]